MKVVLFCGGKGTRWVGGGDGGPKALAMIGDRPIIWHVMQVYAQQGFRDFVLCLGHMGDRIAGWFEAEAGGRAAGDGLLETRVDGARWRIELADTGETTATGGRLARVAPRLGDGPFLASYGDGVADLDLHELLRFHRSSGRLATLTAVRPRSQFGVLDIDGESGITSFIEKPRLEHWVNGGFFVFERGMLEYLGEGPLEEELLTRLAAAGELGAYRTECFWACLDTYKDKIELDELAKEGRAPWIHGSGVIAASS